MVPLARCEQRIWPSGLQWPEGVPAGRLFGAFGDQYALPELVPRVQGEAHTREGRARLGRAGEIDGQHADSRWCAVIHRDELSLRDAFEELFQRRNRTLDQVLVVDDTAFDGELALGPRVAAAVIVGRNVPWHVQLALQRRGLLVGRLPFVCPEGARAWARRVADRERRRAPPRPRVWIISPRHDGFTRALHDNVTDELTAYADTVGVPWRLSEDTDLPSHEMPGIVVLLTHGAPERGDPVGLTDAQRAQLQSCCEAGAVVVHLGCHGGGDTPGDPFLPVAAALGCVVPPGAPGDTFDSFALDCLERGASGVIAHLGVTWSSAFARGSDLTDALSHLLLGRATVGRAHDELMHTARREARAALELRLRGIGTPQVAERWLRALDLERFVLVGDPSVRGA